MDENTILFTNRGNELTVRDVKNRLYSVGIRKGDDVVVHSQIFGIGKPQLDKNDLLNVIIELILDYIGEDGTLIMPTFSYSFCDGEVFDVAKSISKVGILTEAFRNYKGVKRSEHPIFSFAIKGSRESYYLDISDDAFDANSVYGKLIKQNGKLLYFGANVGFTAYYLSEAYIGVPHRYYKNFSGTIILENGKIIEKTVPYYVRDYAKEHNDLDEKKLVDFLVERELINQMNMLAGSISCIFIRRMYESVVSKLRDDDSYFLQ